MKERFVSPGLAGLLLGLVPAAALAQPTYAERLGWPNGARVVIFHVDDAGLLPDANAGAIAALERGVATSTSVMYPCPAAGAMAQYLRQHPAVDAGIHVTLSAESNDDRWSPLAGKGRVASLVDAAGFLRPDAASVVLWGNADEVEAEIRAQLQRCRALGLTPTHLDSH